MTSEEFDVIQEPMLLLFEQEEELEFTIQCRRSNRVLAVQDFHRQRATVQPRVV